MQIQTACRDSVVSVGGRIARFPPPIHRRSNWIPHWFSRISLSPRRKRADLLLELSEETWVASALMEELSVDLPTAGSDIDLIVASRQDVTLTMVRKWVQSGVVPARRLIAHHPVIPRP